MKIWHESPFANIKNSYIDKNNSKFNSTTLYKQKAHGFVHFGVGHKFQRNEVVKGFIDEKHFMKHIEMFNQNRAVKFKSASEYDLFLQENRWPVPK